MVLVLRPRPPDPDRVTVTTVAIPTEEEGRDGRKGTTERWGPRSTIDGEVPSVGTMIIVLHRPSSIFYERGLS